MPYAPGVQDISGQLLGRGIDQGLGALAAGITQNMRRREEKEREKKASELVEQAGRKVFGETFTLKDAPQESWGQIIALEKQQAEAPVRALAMENAELQKQLTMAQLAAQRRRTQQEDVDVNAAREAARMLRPETAADFGARGGYVMRAPAEMRAEPDGMAALAAYMAKGGQNPQMTGDLANLAQSMARKPAWRPTVESAGTGPDGRPVRALMTSPSSAKELTDPKTSDPVARPFSVGGRNLTAVGSHIFDEQGQPVSFGAPREMDPMTVETLHTYYKNTLDQIRDYNPEGLDWFADKAKTAQDIRLLKEKANKLAVRLGYQEPFPKAEELQGEKTPTKQRFKIVDDK